jgi:hypothetical protein
MAPAAVMKEEISLLTVKTVRSSSKITQYVRQKLHHYHGKIAQFLAHAPLSAPI